MDEVEAEMFLLEVCGRDKGKIKMRDLLISPSKDHCCAISLGLGSFGKLLVNQSAHKAKGFFEL